MTPGPKRKKNREPLKLVLPLNKLLVQPHSKARNKIKIGENAACRNKKCAAGISVAKKDLHQPCAPKNGQG